MSQHRSILIVAATGKEMAGIAERIQEGRFTTLDITCRVAGVGMVNTAMHLTRLLSQQRFDLIINVGIAGSFDPALPIGTVVQVTEDRIAWFGAEDHDRFLPFEELGLCPADEVIFTATAEAPHLPNAKGITVNMVHGSAASIRRAVRQYGPQVETMEGAAFFRVCQHFGVRAMQIRAISNRVEPRNREAWDIPLALDNLTSAVLQLLEEPDHGI